MSRTAQYALAVCFAFALAVLLNPSLAQARRPSATASKTYSSGKFLGTLHSDTAEEAMTGLVSDTNDNTAASQPTGPSVHEPMTVNRLALPVHVYKPLHVSLPHATKQFPKIALAQSGR